MDDAASDEWIVIRLVSDGRPEGEHAEACNSLALYLSRESAGNVLIDTHQDERHKSGTLGDIAYHVLDGTAEAVGATVIAAVTSWLRHWWETTGARAEVVVTERDATGERVTTVNADGVRSEVGSCPDPGPAHTAASGKR